MKIRIKSQNLWPSSLLLELIFYAQAELDLGSNEIFIWVKAEGP
jgi:hypothetical protein